MPCQAMLCGSQVQHSGWRESRLHQLMSRLVMLDRLGVGVVVGVFGSEIERRLKMRLDIRFSHDE